MRNFNLIKALTLILILTLAVALFAIPGMAADEGAADQVTEEVATEDNGIGAKAIAAAITIGLASAAGAIGMAWAIVKAVEGISRQPEAEGKIRSAMMLGLVFVETAIIYALIVAVLIIFVL